MTAIVEISFKNSDRSKTVVLEAGDELVIGRSNEDMLMTPDPRLSRRHFLIRYRNGQVELEHLSRTNPTLVASADSRDFQKIKGSTSFVNGCRIIAGFHRFIVTLESQQTLQQSNDSEFSPASSWGDLPSDANDPILPVSPQRATHAEPAARFSFDDSIDYDPSQRSKPGSTSKPKRSAISFESEFQPADPAPPIPAEKRAAKPKPKPAIDEPSVEERRKEKPAKVKPTPKKRESFISFNDDSESFEPAKDENTSATPTKKKAKTPPEEKQSGFSKKLNFPVTDSFFDD